MKKNVAILGSTGSIGTQALDVISRHPERFRVVGLAAGRNTALLAEQVERFKPAVTSSAADGPRGMMRVALESEPDVLLAATDGAVAFEAVFAAVQRGSDIAVANKELIVAAGEVMASAAAASGSRLLPVDSEHSAIFQCLMGEARESVAGIVLTASGGPFWRSSAAQMADATLEQALAHPTWRMGTKNTIDSATMMNKGLEVIEASRFFGLPGEQLHIVVHPQSIAHGFVIFRDGSVKGQLSYPDMRLPIGFALAYPHRLESVAMQDVDALALLGARSPDGLIDHRFERPDPQRFPCVDLAYRALASGGTAPAVLSAANEVAVAAFVEGRIRFGRIATVIEGALDRVVQREATFDGIREADHQARRVAAAIIGDIVQTCC
jgi:1-deoxy-D-xylulose-5-phosphate reductoisomerase